MSDTHGAAAPADHAANNSGPDDGFSPEERAQFAEMAQSDAGAGDSADGAAGGDNGAAAGGAGGAAAPGSADGAAAAAAAPAAGAEGADDDDDDGADPAAAAAADAAAVAAGKPPKRRVSFNKFKSADDRAKALETELAQARVNAAKFEERMTIINEALAGKFSPAAGGAAPAGDVAGAAAAPKTLAELGPRPDPEQDLFGWAKWADQRNEILEAEVKELRAGSQQTSENLAERDLAATYVDDANQFATTEPNFLPAYQFLMDTRIAELAIARFGQVDPKQLTQQEFDAIEKVIAAEERTLVQTALQRRGPDGRRGSPARLIFDMAKARGFKPAAAAAAPAAGRVAPAVAGGAAPAAAAAAAAGSQQQPSVKDEIDRIKAGSDAALSLSSGGGAPASALTAQKLVSMSDAEFGHMMETLDPEKLQELMGA
jgi:hypothetical protein